MRSSHYATPPSHAPRNSRVRHAVALALAGSVVGWASMALAGPEDGQVVSGSANISTPGAGMTLIEQSTHRAVIDWRTFSVGAGETVQFLQPSTSSATLNRVLGGQQSVIDGALRANGNVFLLNSSGILFGRNAAVDVGGLVASTGRMANDDFLAGRYQLQPGAEPGAGVVNEGHLRIRDGGVAALIAPNVRNDGTIVARLGRVALLGSEAVTVDLYGDQLLSFALPGSADGALTGGSVAVTPEAAAAILDGVVNRTGQASANHAARVGDTVVLSSGGSVEHNGTIDVSGPGGGGNVDLLASDIRIGSESLVSADALNAGDGGRVAIWSSGSTEFAGRITARGGAAEGDGGFVEVSGAQRLRFFGDVVATAANGAVGTVLLDPRTITITADGRDRINGDMTDSLIDGDALTALLRSAQNVLLEADESITVNHLIDGRPVTGNASSGTLSMTAGVIVINAPVITNNASINLTSTTGDVTIQGDGFLYVANGVGQSGNAGININAAGNIVTSASGNGAGQLISLGTIALRAGGSVNLGGELAGLRLNGAPDRIGALVVTAVSGGIQLSGVDSRDVVTLAAANGITVGGKGISAGGTVVLDGGAGAVAINASPDPVANTASIEVRGAGGIDIETGGAVTIGGSLRTSNGAIEIGSATERVASVATAANAAVQARGAAGSVGMWSSGAVATRGVAADGGIELAGTTITSTDAPLLATGGGVTLSASRTGASAIVLGAPAQGDAAVETRAAGANVSFSAPGGGVEIGSGIRTNGGAITIGGSAAPVSSLTTSAGARLDTGGSSGAVSIDATGNVALNGVRAGGIVSVTGGIVGNDGASIVSTGTIALNAVSGDLTLGCIPTSSICDAGTPAIDGGSNVALGARGAVVLNGSVKANGSVDVGSADDRVASVSMASGTAIQAGATASATSGISILSDGDVEVQRLIVGSGGRILVDASALGTAEADVRLSQGLGGFAGSDGIGAIRIVADGTILLSGITAAGIPGARAIDIVGSSIETAADSEGSLIAAGGADSDGNGVVLEATGAGGILLRQRMADAPAIDSLGTGSVALRASSGITLESGIRTTGGDILIGTDSNPASSLTTSAIAPLVTENGGDILIRTTGTVQLNGASAGGRIEISGAEVTNSTTTLVAGNDVVVNAGIGGITLNCIGSASDCAEQPSDPDDRPYLAVDAGGATILNTVGAVTLESGVSSRGDILISTASRPAEEVRMGARTALQSGAAIQVHAEGDVALGGLTAGSGMGNGVTIRSGGLVSISAPVSGALDEGDPENSMDDELLPTGYLDIVADSIETHGAYTSGTSPTTPYGIRMVVGSGGQIDIRGALTSLGGQMLIGLESPAAGAGNARINLSNNLFTAGHQIRINGDVMLFEDVGRWDIGGPNDIFGDVFFPGEVTFDDAVTGIDPRWMLHNPADFDVCTGSVSSCFTGATRLNRRVGLESVSEEAVDDPDTGVLPGDVVILDLREIFEFDSLEEAEQAIGQLVADENPFFYVDEQPLIIRVRGPNNQDFYRVSGLQPSGPALAHFLRGLSADGVESASRNDQAGAGCASPSWICGYGYRDDQAAAWNLAVARSERYADLFGQLTATIDTTFENASSGANVVVSGDIRRFAPLDIADNPSNEPGIVADSFINHTLSVSLGQGSLTVEGSLGDSRSFAEQTGSYLDPISNSGQYVLQDIDDPTVQIVGQQLVSVPRLGLFRVNIESSNASWLQVGGTGYVAELRRNGDLQAPVDSVPQTSPGYWQEVDANGSAIGGRVILVPRDYMAGTPWTQESQGTVTNISQASNPTYSTPDTFGQLPGDLGTGSPNLGGSLAGGSSGSVNGGVGRPSNAGAGGTGFNFSTAPETGTISKPPPDIPTAAEDPARQNVDDEAEHDSAVADDEEVRCPRGASRSADTGTTPGVEGSSPPVFKQCAQDFT